jgi:hypothetical protein
MEGIGGHHIDWNKPTQKANCYMFCSYKMIIIIIMGHKCTKETIKNGYGIVVVGKG